MNFQFLEWDSGFFGKKTGRVNTNEIISRTKDLDSHDCDLLYVFSKTRQPHLEEAGCMLLDTRVEFKKHAHVFAAEDNQNITSWHGPVNEQLIQLALSSGEHSRFKKDDLLNHKFRELYERWLVGSVNRTLADELFVCNDEENISGFITVSNRDGQGLIGLVAVNASSQGQGNGSKLLKKCEYWCRINIVSELHVVTQMENAGACKFYLHNGYVQHSVDYIYHYYRHL